ncbi:hypothetical protein AURDEDRAFT_177339 [Auricularia subglabra TFB-10046 SS5]|uniref:Retrotransposon gag domain-containing protein n=1 Tax=Auricularia subglabra (strain TFB-10046 / SS5) TaxID=717982 RepID=J0WMK4_AURST|nr:hypothetical protein AURDEDRAFT_177339 [Auricularia subglabra TFB-10046 SS5]
MAPNTPTTPSPAARRDSVASVTSETFRPTAHSSRLRQSVTFDLPEDSDEEDSVYDTPTPSLPHEDSETEEGPSSLTVRAIRSPPPEYESEHDSDSSEDRVSEVGEVPEEIRDDISFFDAFKQGWYTGWGRPIESDKRGPRRSSPETRVLAVTQTITNPVKVQEAVDEARREKKRAGDKGKERDPRERPAVPQTPARSMDGPSRPPPPATPRARPAAPPAAETPNPARPADRPPETPTPSRPARPPADEPGETVSAIGRMARLGRSFFAPAATHGEITRQDLVAGQPTARYVKAPKSTNAPSQPPGGILQGRMTGPSGPRAPFLAHAEASRILSMSLVAQGRDRRPGGQDPDDPDADGGGGNGRGGRGGGDPPDGDGDNDPDTGHNPDGDADADEDEEEEEEEERQRRMVRSLKLPMPNYDGDENLAKYEAFVYEWDDWLDARQFNEARAVRMMGKALTGKAKEWFMEHVALGTYPWTTRELYQEMWEVFFSDDFREELRNKLMKSKQRGRPIKDFAKDLEKLAIRYPDVDEYSIRRIFWDGSDAYIQLFWAEKGRSLEYDDMNTLLVYAQRAEKRERMKRKLLKQVLLETLDPAAAHAGALVVEIAVEGVLIRPQGRKQRIP